MDNKKSRRPPEAFRAPLAYENPAFLNSPDGRALRFQAEYFEPLARFRREKIQDTVVFFGSARFASLDSSRQKLALLERPGSIQPAPPHEQPANSEASRPEAGPPDDLQVKRARAAVEMSRYYEDARQLAGMLTRWSQSIPSKRSRFVVTSGGGPGIMEAANLGAYEAGGKTIGFNIRLPYEQMPNAYITPELNFEFHYFFMRKYWFAYLAKALVVFPGGFGTMDEMFELLTLAQTGKLAKKMIVVLYGSKYWNEIINFQALVDWGAISPGDMDLVHFSDTPDDAFAYLRENLTQHHLDVSRPRKAKDEAAGPEIAKTLP